MCLLLGSDWVKALAVPSHRRESATFWKKCFIKYTGKSLESSICARGEKLFTKVNILNSEMFQEKNKSY